ncbi:MAG: hypothetical protein K2Y39_13525 [Candidatus Obscuribacterales bacterium]|nr:hypothetical protein [Candidatus Obscuribacterales bacterium]
MYEDQKKEQNEDQRTELSEVPKEPNAHELVESPVSEDEENRLTAPATKLQTPDDSEQNVTVGLKNLAATSIKCSHNPEATIDMTYLAVMAVALAGIFSLGVYLTGSDAVSFIFTATVMHGLFTYIRAYYLLSSTKEKTYTQNDNPGKHVLMFSCYVLAVLAVWLILKLLNFSSVLGSGLVYGGISFSGLLSYALIKIAIEKMACMDNKQHKKFSHHLVPLLCEFLFIVSFLWLAIWKIKEHS